MNAESNLALALSIAAMVVGLALLVWVSLHRAQDWHKFSYVRMFGLLVGSVLVPSPLCLLALRAYPDKPQLFGVLVAAALVLSPFSVGLVSFVIRQIGGDTGEL